jgi:hypothetical protein
LETEKALALEVQRKLLQGEGKPIVSKLVNGRRVVWVGRDVFVGDWLTFHLFLLDYLRAVMGQEWFNAELQKPEKERHPMIDQRVSMSKLMKAASQPGKPVQSAPLTGAAALHLGLAYNLYLIAENSKIRDLLIRRLQNPQQYAPAQYETIVAAALIQAGFELTPEDESDESTRHCEFSAVHPRTGRKFSVEAKRRELHKSTADVGNQLYEALKKTAAYERIVFIDLNALVSGEQEGKDRLVEAVESIRTRESKLKIGGSPAPSAYVVITNFLYAYDLESFAGRWNLVAEGFKIPDFRFDASFDSVHSAVASRDKHVEMFDLLKSINQRLNIIPPTFDGELPEFAFDHSLPRLEIGHTYMIPVGDGKEAPGLLYEATVAGDTAVGVYRLQNGRSVIVSCPLTPEEIVAYKRSPNTFFSVYKPQGEMVRDPVEFYDFMYKTYRHCTKEQLLNFMKDHPDIKELRSKGQEELAKLYCERMAEVSSREKNR